MKSDPLDALNEKFAVRVLVFLLRHKGATKYDLRQVASWRGVEHIVPFLEEKELVVVDKITSRTRGAYHLFLTEVGRRIAENLEMILSPRNLTFQDLASELLLKFYVSDPPIEITGVEARKYILRKSLTKEHTVIGDLEELGYIKVEIEPGEGLYRTLTISLTQKGKDVAKCLLEIKKRTEG